MQPLSELAPVAEPKGFPFPLPILLVRPNLYETDFDLLLEGTLVAPVEAFDTDAVVGRQFEVVIVAWSDFALHDDSPMLDDTRKRLVDWINLTVTPCVRAGRRPFGSDMSHNPPNLLIRTPEDIRADIDERERVRIPASDPARPIHKPEPGRKRPITVTVSGPRTSGKTTLIAVVAQALRGSNHLVKTPAHVPSAAAAIADLHEQFDISFVESDDPPIVNRYTDEINALKAERDTAREAAERAWTEVATLREQLTAARGSLSVAIDTSAVQPLVDETMKAVDATVADNEALAASLESAEAKIDQLNEALVSARAAIGQFEEDKARLSAAVSDYQEQIKALQAPAPGSALEAFAEHMNAAASESLAEKLKAAEAKIAQLNATLDEFRAALIERSRERAEFEELASDLSIKLVNLEASRLTPDAAAREIAMAFEEHRQAVILDNQRQDFKVEIERLQGAQRMLGDESKARTAKATDRLMQVFTGASAPVKSETAFNKLERANASVVQAAAIATSEARRTRDPDGAAEKLARVNAVLMAD